MQSILAQFLVTPVQGEFYGLTNLFITTSYIVILICAFSLLYRYSHESIQIIWSWAYRFSSDIVEKNAKHLGALKIVFVQIFYLLVALNFIGLIGYGFTATASLLVPFMISMTIGAIMVQLAFYYRGYANLNFFVSESEPEAVQPLVLLIELISYFIRPLSLGIRLFANMFAGHVLFHLMSELAAAGSHGGLFLFWELGPFAIFQAIQNLELVIAVLQAFVLITISSIYFGEITKHAEAH